MAVLWREGLQARQQPLRTVKPMRSYAWIGTRVTAHGLGDFLRYWQRSLRIDRPIPEADRAKLYCAIIRQPVETPRPAVANIQHGFSFPRCVPDDKGKATWHRNR